jgi:uncharacterized protein (TIGR03437 family)
MGIRLAKSLCLVLAAVSPFLLTAYPGGPPIRRTGAPGDRTCLDASCHVGVRLDHSTGLRLETGANFSYTPGGPPQRWILRIDDSFARVFGFQMSVRTAAAPESGAAGRLRAIEPGTQVVCDNQVLAGEAGCTPAAPVQFAGQTEPREQGQFAVEWVPPSHDSGDVLVYVAANASVTGQRDSRIHLATFRLRPALTQGVVDAASLRRVLSPGAWGTIYGGGLAQSTRSLRGEDIREGELPVALDGVRVLVSNRPAAIQYISPGQINFQAPDAAAGRETPVEVWLHDRRVASHRVNYAERTPGLFVVSKDGRDYVAALHSDGCVVDALRREAGFCGKPARAGEAIAVYASGLGATEPHIPAGRVVSAAARTVAPVTARISGRDARVLFAGLVGAGLYQVNLVVPSLPPGDHPIELSIERQSTQAHVYVNVE